MIELAPHHKSGLPVDSPILLAGGSAGYGEALHPVIDPARLGAIVVGPITRRSIRGSDTPRLAETNGGFVLNTGLQNRGVSAVVKNFARLWPRFGCPVVAQIADNSPEDAAATARRLAGLDGLLGLELLTARDVQAAEMRHFFRGLRRSADLPVWVKLPLPVDTAVALAAAEAGADGLVVGSPLPGAALHPRGELVQGNLYGPGLFPQMLAGLAAVTALSTGLPLIACGGIHTPAQVAQSLALGASAVQLDTLLWVEPDAVAQMAEIRDWGVRRG